jgi:hypothetical protein
MWMKIYDPSRGLGADRRPFNRTVARARELRLAGGVVRREATTKPMMQRIQGLLGSSLPRLDGVATGLDLLLPFFILPHRGLKFGYRWAILGLSSVTEKMKIDLMIQ